MSMRKEFKVGEKRVLKKDKDGLIEKGLSTKEEERKVGEKSNSFKKNSENKQLNKKTASEENKYSSKNTSRTRLNRQDNKSNKNNQKNSYKNNENTENAETKKKFNQKNQSTKFQNKDSDESVKIDTSKKKTSQMKNSKRLENLNKKKELLSDYGTKKNEKFIKNKQKQISNLETKKQKLVQNKGEKRNSKLKFKEGVDKLADETLAEDNIGIESTKKTYKSANTTIKTAKKLKHLGDENSLKRTEKKIDKLNKKEDKIYRNLSKKEKIHMENIKRANNKRKRKLSSGIKNKTESFASGVKEDLKKKIKKVAESITKKKIGFSMLAFLGMGAVAIGIIMASIFFIQNFENSVMATSYVASDENVTNADSLFQEEETKLIKNIADTEKNFSGYDGYEYNIDPIGHNPQMFTAYLTIKYKDYKLNEIKPYILSFFNEMYKLTRKAETRSDSNGNSITILITTLETKDMEELILSKLNEEEKKIYKDLMETKGNYMSLDQLYEDKDIDWKTRLTRPFGYYLENGNIEYSDGMVFIGDSNIKNLYEGIVSNIEQDGSKYNVTITNKNKPIKERFKVIYKGLTSVAVNKNQKLEKGDLLGKTGNTFTITVEKNGVKFNPYFYLFSPNDDIPQILIKHINGTGGNVVNPDINFSGQEIAFDEATTKKLFAEAQKYIGMPYVYGGSNPSTSFDCSGYICWVYTKSGVRNMPRTTAQGIYNSYTVPISPSEAKVGDLVFFQNTYNFHEKITHIGIYVGNGQMLHCGDPIGYANLNSSYWKSKFYGFGRPAI